MTVFYSQIVGYFGTPLSFQTCSVGGNFIVFPWADTNQPSDFNGFDVNGIIYDSMDLATLMPAQYPVFEGLYGKWRVIRSKIKVTVIPSINNGSGQSPQSIQLSILPSNNFNVTTGITHQIAESPLSKSKLIAPGFGKSNSLSCSASSERVMGLSRTEYADQSFTGQTASCSSGRGNPSSSNRWVWIVNFAAADGNAIGITQFQVEMWWTVQFSDPRMNAPYDTAQFSTSTVADFEVPDFPDMSSLASSLPSVDPSELSSSSSSLFDSYPSSVSSEVPHPSPRLTSRLPLAPHDPSLKPPQNLRESPKVLLPGHSPKVPMASRHSPSLPFPASSGGHVYGTPGEVPPIPYMPPLTKVRFASPAVTST